VKVSRYDSVWVCVCDCVVQACVCVSVEKAVCVQKQKQHLLNKNNRKIFPLPPTKIQHKRARQKGSALPLAGRVSKIIKAKNTSGKAQNLFKFKLIKSKIEYNKRTLVQSLLSGMPPVVLFINSMLAGYLESFFPMFIRVVYSRFYKRKAPCCFCYFFVDFVSEIFCSLRHFAGPSST